MDMTTPNQYPLLAFFRFSFSGLDIKAATTDPAISAALAAVASTAYQLPKVRLFLRAIG